MALQVSKVASNIIKSAIHYIIHVYFGAVDIFDYHLYERPFLDLQNVLYNVIIIHVN